MANCAICSAEIENSRYVLFTTIEGKTLRDKYFICINHEADEVEQALPDQEMVARYNTAVTNFLNVRGDRAEMLAAYDVVKSRQPEIQGRLDILRRKAAAATGPIMLTPTPAGMRSNPISP